MRNRCQAIITMLLLAVSGLSFAADNGLLPPSKDTLKSLNVQARSTDKAIPIEQSWHLSKSEAKGLLNSQLNDKISISGFPAAITGSNSDSQEKRLTDVVLTRYNFMAPGATITVISESGQTTIKQPDLMAFSSSKHGIGILLNPNTGDITGIFNQSGVSMDINGNTQTGLDLRRNDEGMPGDERSQQCHTAMADQPGDIIADLTRDMMSNSLELNNRGTIDYETIVAVDTDNEWMLGKGNNTTTAFNYIASLFVNMNVFFERDLALRVLIGNVTMRTSTDPYPTVSSIFDSLNDFGEYWRVNNAAVDRDFTVLLSGQSIGSLSFSGIAWVNQYCQNGFLQNGGTETVGSYSVNRIGSSLSTGFTAPFLAHELGHNMGSPHTHCYVPVVDECYNAEGSCYAGPVSCPAGGSGTIMSYCHFGPPNGANCGSSDEEFHPTVISLFNSRILSNFPSCIQALGSDIIFVDNFDS